MNMHAKLLYKDKIAMSRTFANFSRMFHFYSQICFPDLEKNPALQDSPPAAGRFCDIIPFRRSAIIIFSSC